MSLWELDAGLTRGVFVKPEVVAIAGDLVVGTVLSQIMYWCRPDKNGASKLRVRHDGRYWIAKTHEQWQAECGATGKQLRRVFDVLEGNAFIERMRKKFNGETMTHISLNEEVLHAALLSYVTYIQKGQSEV